MPTADLAAKLLDAQVSYHVDRLTGEQLAPTIEQLADQLFDAAGKHQLADLVDRAAIQAVVTRSLGTVPGSGAVQGIVELVTGLLNDGPQERFTLGEVVDRERMIVFLDEALALSLVLERALERLTESPLVGTMASRFMGRIVAEVMAANKAVAGVVPGLGSLVSFGTSAASKVVGAADKQLEGLIGDTVGKGGTYAVRRLNRIVLDTIQDPTTREALVQVWDLLAAEPVVGLSRHISQDELASVVAAGQDLVVDTLSRPQVAALGEAVVDAFFEWFGGYTPTELLDELEIRREDVVADLVRMAPDVVEALRASGDLERIVRAQLEPFYASPEVLQILGDPPV